MQTGRTDNIGRAFSDECVSRALRSFSAAVRGIGRAFCVINDAMYLCAEAEYLKEHRRLPGSERTSRLRKKRRAFVLRWFYDQLRDGRYCFVSPARPPLVINDDPEPLHELRPGSDEQRFAEFREHMVKTAAARFGMPSRLTQEETSSGT